MPVPDSGGAKVVNPLAFFSTVDGIPQDSRPATVATVLVHPHFQKAMVGLYISLAVDVIASSWTDIVYSDRTVVHLVVFCIQLLTFLSTTIVLYMLLSETFLVKKVLYRRVVEEFRAFFIVGPVYMLLLLALRMYRLGLIYTYYPHLAIWDQPGYHFLYIAHKFGALAYWLVVMRSASYLLREPKLYTNESVHKMR